MSSSLERLKPIIAPYLEDSSLLEEVREDTNLKAELNVDSVDVVEIILDVESEFNIHFLEDEIRSIQTLDDLMKMVSAKTQ